MATNSVSIRKIRSDLNGRVIGREDPEYDEARSLFYGGFDRRPEAIVRVADDGDVSRGISLARDSGLELAVRSGGHSLAGHSVSDGGIVLDLSDMKALDIDPQARTAWVQTGLTAGEYTVAAAAHGLGTGFGDTGSVGIGGITLGGGSATSSGSTASLSTTCWPPMSSPPTAASSAWTPRLIPTSSGRSVVVAATSAWPPGSGSACTRWGPSSGAC
jgi:FAD/FMN-containing dehydrogenase